MKKTHTLSPREQEAKANAHSWTVWIAGVRRACPTEAAARELAVTAVSNIGGKALVYALGLINNLEVDALVASYSELDGWNEGVAA